MIDVEATIAAPVMSEVGTFLPFGRLLNFDAVRWGACRSPMISASS
jgi:hypothetical protein